MAESEPALIEATELVVRFPVRRGLVGALARQPRELVHAVEGVSLSVGRGELVALVGESGSGKTTTGQALLRLVEPERGRIRFDGEDISRLGERALQPLRRRMQLIYQDPYESLDPRFRVRQTLEEPLFVHGLARSAAERENRLAEAMARTGLTPPELFLDRYPHELSGGQRQRVAIAAALVLEPDFIVADEPVSMLDVSVRAGILALLEQQRRAGLGVLMITHDLSTAARYADRIAVMYLGRIVEEGSARAIVQRPRHPYTKALISVVPRRDPRDRRAPQILDGEVPDPVAVPGGCRFHPRCPAAFERCPRDDPRELVPAGTDGHRAACWLVGP